MGIDQPKRRIFTLVLALICTSFQPVSAAGVLPRHAAFFRDDFDAVFAGAASWAYLIGKCRQRFGGDCIGSPAEAENGLVEKSAKVAGDITVFDPGYREVDSKRFRSSYEMLSTLTKNRAEFLQNLMRFEEGFLARFSAVADACPDRNLSALANALIEVDFNRFWALSPAQLEQVNQSIAENRQRNLLKVKRELNERQCAETRDFGAIVAVALRDKIKPFLTKEKQAITVNDRFGEGYEFVFGVAAVFQDAATHNAEQRP
jgi:hypothetical protein